MSQQLGNPVFANAGGVPDTVQNVQNHREEEHKSLTPEILGYLYEKFVISIDSLKEINLDNFSEYPFNKSDLLVGNKKIGAYYTPERLTNYISTNILWEYLQKKLPIISDYNTPESFLSNIGSIDTSLRNQLNSIIDNIKICDPAVGSGALLCKFSLEGKGNFSSNDMGKSRRLL